MKRRPAYQPGACARGGALGPGAHDALHFVRQCICGMTNANCRDTDMHPISRHAGALLTYMKLAI